MLPQFSFPARPAATAATDANASSNSSVPLDQLLGEAGRTNHQPLQNKYGGHPLVMFDHKRTADQNLVGGWTALMNLGRKGDAERLRQIGVTTFGEKDFEGAISAAIFYGSGNPPVEEAVATAAFARVEVAANLQAASGDDRETAKKCLAAAAQAFGDLRQQGVADKIEAVFKNAFGKDLAEYKEDQKSSAA